MTTSDQIFIESVKELRIWLQKHCQKSSSVWLVKWKKSSNRPFVSYDEIVDELICFGWVDSLPRKLNEQQSMLRISPRHPKSSWSAINKKRVERLTKSKKMKPSGLQLINQAKQNGAWNFLDDVEQLLIPSDLELALSTNEKAKHYFDRFPPSSKRSILEWLKNAKQAKTRQKRVEEIVVKAAENRKANHPKGRDLGPSKQKKTS